MWISRAGLLLNGLHHFGMAVAGGHDGDSGVEVEEAVAVHVLHDGAFAVRATSGIAARVGRRHYSCVALDDGPRARTRQGGLQNRKVHADLFE